MTISKRMKALRAKRRRQYLRLQSGETAFALNDFERVMLDRVLAAIDEQAFKKHRDRILQFESRTNAPPWHDSRQLDKSERGWLDAMHGIYCKKVEKK